MKPVIAEFGQASKPYLVRVTFVRGRIEEQPVDAIVTLLSQSLRYKGSLNEAIQKAAGHAMDVFINENIHEPRLGDVYAAPGFDLPCKHVLYAVRPTWKDDFERQDRDLLIPCRKVMEEARAMSLKTLAFPPLGSGHQGFAKPKAARLMMQAIMDRMYPEIEEVRIVARTQETLDIFHDRFTAMVVKS